MIVAGNLSGVDGSYVLNTRFGDTPTTITFCGEPVYLNRMIFDGLVVCSRLVVVAGAVLFIGYFLAAGL